MLRFTETLKWSDPFFKSLNLEMKTIYQYLLDVCDRSGFWFPEIDVLCLRVGFATTPEKILHELKPIIRVCKDGMWHIGPHMKLQYPNGLSENNNLHKSVVRDLQKREAIEKSDRSFADTPGEASQIFDVPAPSAPPGGQENSAGGVSEALRDGAGDGAGAGLPPKGSEMGVWGKTPPGGHDAVTVVGAILAEFAAQGAEQSGDLPPFTIKALVTGFDRLGPNRTRKAVGAYIRARRAQHKGPGIRNFADRMDEYAPAPPVEKCRHTWEEYTEKVTDHPLGPVVLMRRCTKLRCNVTQAKHGTKSASLVKQKHVCQWQDFTEGLHPEALAMARRNGQDTKQICNLCGDTRDKQTNTDQEDVA